MMWMRQIGIDPIQRFKLILQKLVPCFRYYVHDGLKDDTRHILIQLLDLDYERLKKM